MTALAAQLLSAREVAAVYGKTIGHVHLLAHRNRWRRIKWLGRVYYDLAEVDAALGAEPTCETTPL